MSEVLFGQSYYLRFDPKLWAAKQPYPPLGTLYAASYLRSRGYTVSLFDAMLAQDEQEWEGALAKHRPRVAILFEDNFNYLSKMCLLRMRQAAWTMIDMARVRGCIVIVAGSDASDHPEAYLAHGADIVLLGEGEHTLGEVMDSLSDRSPRPVSAIPGLAYVDSCEDRTVRTPSRPDIQDLDALPFPAWDLIDVSHYQSIWYRYHGRYSMNMVTTRGCPFSCNWCAKPIWGRRYNSRSPENVVAELRWLRDAYNPDHIWFADDIMGLKPAWLHSFADLVEEHGVRIPFKSLHRADLLLRRDTIAALQRAGAETVWVGAESGSQQILDAMEKGTQVEQILEATRRLQVTGIDVGWFLQFGYPGEGLEDIEKTLEMVRRGKPDDIGISVSYPLPGTRFYESVRQQLVERQNWIDSADLAMLYNGPFTTAFYRKLHTVVHKEFRAQRAWSEIRGMLRRPSVLRLRHLHSTARLAFHRATLPAARRQLSKLATLPPETATTWHSPPEGAQLTPGAGRQFRRLL